MSTWWIPPSGEGAMILEVPDSWNGVIENNQQVIDLVTMKLDALFQEAREDPTGDGMLDLRQGLATLEQCFGLSLLPETARGIDITTYSAMKTLLLSLCVEEDSETPLTFPQQATETEEADPRETFSEWADRLAMTQ
jgi:hypothetical protein